MFNNFDLRNNSRHDVVKSSGLNDTKVPVRAVASSVIGGGGGLIFIYSCSQTIKTIDFKRN